MTPFPVTIRRYDAATDTETLSRLWLDASLEAHPFVGETRLADQRRLVETKYLPIAETWVACDADGPVGFISLLESFVGGLFVAPAHQRQGVGDALLAHAMARRNQLSLEVYTRNTSAVRFYRAHGFQEVSRRQIDDNGLPLENARLVWRR